VATRTSACTSETTKRADPRQAEPFSLPLAEIGAWTRAFRAQREAAHRQRAAREDAAGAAAWDALGRHEADPQLVGELSPGPDAPPDGVWGWAAWHRPPSSLAVRLLAPQDAPGKVDPYVDPAPTVKRYRRRREHWRALQADEYGPAGTPRRSWKVKKVLVPAHLAHESSRKWHAGRAEGQKHRIATVGGCGAGTVRVVCHGCGSVHESPVRCGVVRLCPGCNIRRSTRARARFGVSLAVVLHHAKRAGSFDKFRKGGRLGQHFYTLTVPHVRTTAVVGTWGWCRTEHEGAWRKATAKRRVTLLFAAWKRFARRLQDFFRRPWNEKTAVPPAIGSCWSRAFEWTPGQEGDGLGHPHFHLWALTPWIPLWDDHRIDAIEDGKVHPSARCKAQRPTAGVWGWAETMRKERCPYCVAPEPSESRAAFLDRYYAQPRALEWSWPVVPRRSGLRTWWTEALAAEGAPIDERKAQIDVRAVDARPRTFIKEVRKPNGLTFRERKTGRVEIVEKGGQIIDYFEGWCLGMLDEQTWRVAGADVIAGVFEALEGRRLSQASKVTLRKRDGAPVVVGFYGIADARVDGSCQDCNDHATKERLPHPGFPRRSIEVVSIARAQGRRLAAPALPPGTGPPHESWVHAGPTPEIDRVALLVRELRFAEALESGDVGRKVARLFEVTELVRELGPSILPAYRRGGRAKERPPLSFRGLMKLQAKRRRA
jgi:hypothetical protein